MLNIWLRVVLCFSVSWCSELSLKLVIFVLKYHWKVIELHVCGNPDRWQCHFVDCQSTHMVQMTKGGGWGCEVSCGGHHRQRGKTTTGSALDGAVLDGTPKNFWLGCAAPVFDRIPLAKEILLENIPLAKEHFLTMSSFLHDFKKFQPQNSLFKRNFPKTDANLAPKCHFLGDFVKNIPLAKECLPKINPWLRNLGSKKVTIGSGTPPVRST